MKVLLYGSIRVHRQEKGSSHYAELNQRKKAYFFSTKEIFSRIDKVGQRTQAVDVNSVKMFSLTLLVGSS